MVDYPCLKTRVEVLFSKLWPIQGKLSVNGLLEGILFVTLDAEGWKRPEELSVWYMTHQIPNVGAHNLSHIVVA